MQDADLIVDEAPEDDTPPVLGNWRNVYAVVLTLHLLLILAFYFFSRAYTV